VSAAFCTSAGGAVSPWGAVGPTRASGDREPLQRRQEAVNEEVSGWWRRPEHDCPLLVRPKVRLLNQSCEAS